MSKRLSGAWFKLVDFQGTGTDIGMLMVPEEIGRHLERAKIAWTDYRRVPLASALRGTADHYLTIEPNVSQFHIARAPYPHEDAIMVIGLSAEEIGKQSGFCFMPSAEYIRAMLAPKPEPVAVAPRPEPSGPYLEAARAVTLGHWGAKSP